MGETLFALSELIETFGNNQKKSFHYLERAAMNGSPSAQHALSAAYAVGYYGGHLIGMDAGKAFLLEHMAAQGGHPEANMGLGYRYLYGVGVPASCEIAINYYEFAANFAENQMYRRGYLLYAETSKLSGSDSGSNEIDPEVCRI